MKYIYMGSVEQIKTELERQTRYLECYLAEKRNGSLVAYDYIKVMFKIINACKLALKEKEKEQ